MAAIRLSKYIRNDKDISWEDMLDAKNVMLHFMAKSRQWEDAHTTSIASFFYNLETHQRKDQKNGKRTLLLYQSYVHHKWFNALKQGEGFNMNSLKKISSVIMQRKSARLSKTAKMWPKIGSSNRCISYSHCQIRTEADLLCLFPTPIKTSTLHHSHLTTHHLPLDHTRSAACHLSLLFAIMPLLPFATSPRANCHLNMCHLPIAVS